MGYEYWYGVLVSPQTLCMNDSAIVANATELLYLTGASRHIQATNPYALPTSPSFIILSAYELSQYLFLALVVRLLQIPPSPGRPVFRNSHPSRMPLYHSSAAVW